jgi:hypothetical protein
VAGIYSTQFCLSSGASNVGFVVPAGQVAVVRCVTAFNRNAAAASYDVRINPPLVYVVGRSLSAAGTPGSDSYDALMDLHLVVKAGQTIFLDCVAGVDGTVSGYLFTA